MDMELETTCRVGEFICRPRRGSTCSAKHLSTTYYHVVGAATKDTEYKKNSSTQAVASACLSPSLTRAKAQHNLMHNLVRERAMESEALIIQRRADLVNSIQKPRLELHDRSAGFITETQPDNLKDSRAQPV